MKCKWTQEKLSERFGRWLTDDERQQVNTHLARCEACREVADQLRLSVAYVRELPESRVSSQFLSRLRAALPERRLPAWRLWFRSQFGFGVSYIQRRVALAGAMATVLFIGTGGVIQKKQAERRSAEYLAHCVQRHALYASSGPLSDSLDGASDESGERAASLWH